MKNFILSLLIAVLEIKAGGTVNRIITVENSFNLTVEGEEKLFKDQAGFITSETRKMSKMI
jgi:hypothetical protein